MKAITVLRALFGWDGRWISQCWAGPWQRGWSKGAQSPILELEHFVMSSVLRRKPARLTRRRAGWDSTSACGTCQFALVPGPQPSEQGWSMCNLQQGVCCALGENTLIGQVRRIRRRGYGIVSARVRIFGQWLHQIPEGRRKVALLTC
jgi:hypothetical protein